MQSYLILTKQRQFN